MDDALPETLSMAEAAKFLRLGYESTKALFENGELVGLSLNQKHTVFLRADLVAFVHERGLLQAAERRRRSAGPSTARRLGRPRRAALPDLAPYESALDARK